MVLILGIMGPLPLFLGTVRCRNTLKGGGGEGAVDPNPRQLAPNPRQKAGTQYEKVLSPRDNDTHVLCKQNAITGAWRSCTHKG